MMAVVVVVSAEAAVAALGLAVIWRWRQRCGDGSSFSKSGSGITGFSVGGGCSGRGSALCSAGSDSTVVGSGSGRWL